MSQAALTRYLATRIALGVVTLLLVSGVTFLATNVVPADPARTALGQFATDEQVALYHEQQGLDDPVLTRYLRWIGHAARGDLGTSAISHSAVTTLVAAPMVRTIILGGAAMVVAVALGFAFGVFAGLRVGRRVDVAITTLALCLNSLPEFVIGLVLLVVLAVELPVFPVESSGAAFDSGLTAVKAYVLPVLTLALFLTPYLLRMVRANVRDVVGQPFIRASALRGLPRRRIIWRHVVPNASLPVISVIALTSAELVGGVVVIETVFGFPGIGRLLVEATSGKDIPTVQAVVLVMGTGYVLLNFAADAVLLALNPRLRTR